MQDLLRYLSDIFRAAANVLQGVGQNQANKQMKIKNKCKIHIYSVGYEK